MTGHPGAGAGAGAGRDDADRDRAGRSGRPPGPADGPTAAATGPAVPAAPVAPAAGERRDGGEGGAGGGGGSGAFVRFPGRAHDERTAALLGVALGVGFAVCFVTGVLSHLAQHPPGWLPWPTRPAGLYRVTQGTHVVTGFGLIPLTLAKLWVAYPRFFQRPAVRSAGHAAQRAALLPLVGGALFLLVSGVLNVARWYPWSFFFPTTHYWAAWVTVGAVAVHVGTTWAVARRVLGRHRRPPALLVPDGPGAAADAGPDRPGGPVEPIAPGERRAFLAAVAGTAALVALGAAGGTVPGTSALSAFAQRRPHQGPQGVPINKTAVGAGVVEAATDAAWRLEVTGAVDRPLSLSLDDLRTMRRHEAELPITCVEGWSTSARWGGVRVADLLAAAGARPGAAVTVESLQEGGRYRASDLDAAQARDRDTLLALELNGSELHIDHGYPVRLIGPNRPGVLQTKWLARLVVR